MLIFAFVGALFHVFGFVMESLLWGKPKTNKVFRMTSEQAKAASLLAFNQGFYNLFLALGALVGILATLLQGHAVWSDTLILYSCASMTGAGLVLLVSKPKMFRAALLQAGPPVLAIAGWCVGF
jgi:putative membrane protein